jgi:solute carrier family 20 (sodium-dependent phosphate transporter)
MAVLREYLWIAVCGGILGFIYGFLIGANDVANAFASSVSSKSITVVQAVMIAAVFEFSGALLLGASVTGTIRSKIVDIDLYVDEPALFMFGMFSALFSANLNLWCATAFGYPVSTTHDIVGSIMGFSIAAKGFDSVEWDVAIKIFISWFASPVLSGTVAATIFASVKYGVLKSENTFQRAFWTFPIIITVGITINIFYVLFKGFNNKPKIQDVLEWYIVLPISFAVGLCCGAIWLFGVGPVAVRRVEAKRALRESAEAKAEGKVLEGAGDSEVLADDDDEEVVKGKVFDVDGEEAAATPEQAPEPEAPKSLWGKFAAATYKQDLHAQAMSADDGRTQEVWDKTERYDPDTENLFTYLQVFTACLNSFAHGANDVANTISPMSAIIQVYQTGEVKSKAQVEKWKLAFGGAAIVCGLLLYGYKVMQTLGFKLVMMTPSRGFSAELGSSLVVVTASFIGIPVSTTQCIVGAVFGVGLVSGCKNVQWFYLFKVCCSWVILFFCATVLSAGIFSFGAFSPGVE